jgi:hypothetical protein
MTKDTRLRVTRRALSRIRQQLSDMHCAQFGHTLGPSKQVGAEHREYASCKRCHAVVWNE